MKSSKIEVEKIKVGISAGDFNSIAPEVILKTFTDQRNYNFFTPICYASTRVLNYHRKALKVDRVNYQSLKEKDTKYLREKTINVVDAFEDNVIINLGQSSNQAGKNAMNAIDECLQDLKSGFVDAMVTAPINKSNIEKEGFTGHTEYITQFCEVTDSIMLLVGNQLKIGLQTNHLPLKDVAGAITTGKILKKIELLNSSMEKDFGIDKPKIAVFGLNPHAGDDGLLGKEEKEIIMPAIEKAKENGIYAFGPYAADGFMGAGHFKKFDAVLAMYHDQGLVAFKSIEFGSGVNYTAGLPVVRTSPDHGTAYEIAGKGNADESSFRSALFLARDIVLNRRRYSENHANPLKKSSKSHK